MKCRLAKLLVFLLLGAIVNVAVAWGSVVWIQSAAAPKLTIFDLGSDRYFSGYASSSLSAEWLVLCDRVLKANVNVVRGDREIVPLPAWSRYSRLMPDNESASNTIEEARGWPGRAFSTCWRMTAQKLTPVDGIQIPDWPATAVPLPFVKRALPLRPIWPGFAINTVFYAGVLWLLFAAPFALRRRRRIKRGLCPKCAYPVGTNNVCTECGATVNVRSLPEFTDRP